MFWLWFLIVSDRHICSHIHENMFWFWLFLVLNEKKIVVNLFSKRSDILADSVFVMKIWWNHVSDVRIERRTSTKIDFTQLILSQLEEVFFMTETCELLRRLPEEEFLWWKTPIYLLQMNFGGGGNFNGGASSDGGVFIACYGYQKHFHVFVPHFNSREHSLKRPTALYASSCSPSSNFPCFDWLTKAGLGIGTHFVHWWRRA